MRFIPATLAALLLATFPASAAEDFNGSGDMAVNNAAVATAYPFTICLRFNADSQTTTHSLFYFKNSANANYAGIDIDGAGTDRVRAYVSNGSSSTNAVTSAAYTAGIWHSACGVWASATSRVAYLDGGNSGNETTNLTPTGLDQTNVATYDRSGFFFNGKLAEIAVWSVALSGEEVAMLGKGYAPPCVRRDKLMSYWPMTRESGPIRDFSFGSNLNRPLTLTGGSVADHPPVITCQ